MTAQVNAHNLIERIFRNPQGRTLLWAKGTRAELIESGLAAEYMFDMLGDKNTKGARTEYGDIYSIGRCWHGRYSLKLELLPEPKNPHGMGYIDPYDTDISGILERISAT